jgi:nitrogen regulatory protein P-II 1
MKNIEAVIRQFKLDDIKDALAAFGTQGLTICEVIGFGGQRGGTEIYRGPRASHRLPAKVKLKIILIEKIPTPVNRDHGVGSAHGSEC